MLTGLPGKLSTGVPSTTVRPCGPPGCIATWWNQPPRGMSVSRTTSKSPIDTPPEVTTTSASVMAASSRSLKVAVSSVLCATDVTSAPLAVAAAASAMPLEL